MKVYEIITNKIIEQLEKGTVTWRKPWKVEGSPMNFVSKRPYRGLNVFLLNSEGYSCPYWASFKQINKLGGKVKKGAKSSIIIYWKILDIEDRNDKGEDVSKKIPLLRYYRVFNLEQTEGIEYKTENKREKVNNIDECEDIVNCFLDKPKINHNEARAYYSPNLDYINMPKKDLFDNAESYYSTLFHELTHSTGAEHRVNRKSVVEASYFGSENYSKEELVAELGASFLCGICGIENTTINNSVAYIQGWLKALKNDKKLIIYASAQAQKAVDYILKDREKMRQITVAQTKALVKV